MSLDKKCLKCKHFTRIWNLPMMLFKFSAQYFWHVIQVCMYVSKTQMHPCLKHRHVLRIYFGLHIFDLHHNYRDWWLDIIVTQKITVTVTSATAWNSYKWTMFLVKSTYNFWRRVPWFAFPPSILFIIWRSAFCS